VNVILAAILLWQIQLSPSWPENSPSTLTDYIPCIIYLSFIPAAFLKEAIRYKQIKYTSAETSPLFGIPGAETDAAWNRLIDDASLRLSETEVSSFNSSSIDLQESSGKLAWLEVSHQIHCVVSQVNDITTNPGCILMLNQDYIRKAISRNHYYAELPDSEWQEYIKPHIGVFESTAGRECSQTHS
jgi:hypothetical protein